MWMLALIQASLLVQPLYLGESPPELRSMRGIRLLYTGVADCPPDIVRSEEDTLALASDLVARLRHGTSFESIAAEYAPPGEWKNGCVVGSFTPGTLSADFDRFLFASKEGELSDPIATSNGIHILQRIETRAAVCQLYFKGNGTEARERCVRALEKLREGADFAQLARQLSEDKPSAARGGQFAIYERGVRDTLLKKAAFQLAVGELSGPIESPWGYHILKRVPISEVDATLAESNFVRVRTILIQFDTARGADPATAAQQSEAKAVAMGLYERLQAHEDMRALAGEFDQDLDGRERHGDLGWLYRYSPNLPDALRRVFLMRPGETTEPFSTPVGYLIVRRER